MAIVFHQCRSCGGKTQINTGVSPAEQRCPLCGKECGEEDIIDTAEGDLTAEEKPVAKEKRLHQPRELAAVNCPRCKTLTTVAVAKPVEKQRCHNCGRLLEKAEAPRKSRMRKRSKVTTDGLLIEQTKERVWLPMAGFGLCIALIAIFVVWMMEHPKADVAPPAVPEPPSARDEIRKLAGLWMNAKTPEELLALIRAPEQFGPPLREWCASHPGALPLGGAILGITNPRPVLGVQVAEAAIRFNTVPGMNLMAVETPAGWKVEWRGFSGIADLSVEEFVEKKPASPTLVMVVAQRSDYYNGSYTDSNAWFCLRLNDRSDAHPFYAYVPRAKADLMTVMNALPPAPRPAAKGKADLVKASRLMALRLHFNDSESASHGQAEVTSIAGESWYVP